MSLELKHRIEAAAPPERVWDALVTSVGIAGWWTTDRAGVTAIDETVRPKRPVWTCLGDFDE